MSTLCGKSLVSETIVHFCSLCSVLSYTRSRIEVTKFSIRGGYMLLEDEGTKILLGDRKWTRDVHLERHQGPGKLRLSSERSCTTLSSDRKLVV